MYYIYLNVYIYTNTHTHTHAHIYRESELTIVKNNVTSKDCQRNKGEKEKEISQKPGEKTHI